jgi:hypothetical protein
LDEAKNTLDQASAHNLDGGNLRTFFYLLAFRIGIFPEIEKVLIGSDASVIEGNVDFSLTINFPTPCQLPPSATLA